MIEERKKQEREIENNSCSDVTCPEHGNLKARGRIFKSYVVKKFPRRIVVEFERVVYVRKYERYAKKKTRLHARLPECKKDKVNVGDYVLIQECRPLSKIIHFVFLRKVKASDLQTNRISVEEEKEGKGGKR